MTTQLYLALATNATFANGPAEGGRALFNEKGLWFVDTYQLHIYALKELQGWSVTVRKTNAQPADPASKG